MYPFFNKKIAELDDKLAELLSPYEEGYAMSLDKEFRDVMSTLSNVNISQLTEASVIGDSNPTAESTAARLPEPTPGVPFGTERVIDLMQTYYKVNLLSLLIAIRASASGVDM